MHSWPLFDLRVVTDRLTLRVATDAEVDALAQRAVGRVLAPEQACFMGPWTQLPSPAFERDMLQYHWALRGAWTPQQWRLQLGIFPDGVTDPVGMMDIGARDFARSRSVSTGSWMLADYRGAGLGREARRAVLSLAFDTLGAQEARSTAHPDNRASLAVSCSTAPAGPRSQTSRCMAWTAASTCSASDYDPHPAPAQAARNGRALH